MDGKDSFIFYTNGRQTLIVTGLMVIFIYIMTLNISMTQFKQSASITNLDQHQYFTLIMAIGY